MKKLSIIALILILILFTPIIKNSTKRINDMIFSSEENIRYLKKDYEKLGYSSDEIVIHLLKLMTTPLFYGVLTILSAIIMFNIRKDRSLIFHIIMGIFMSVVIYYINFMFSSLGNTGKIPINISIFLPIFFISIIATIGLIRVNEK